MASRTVWRTGIGVGLFVLTMLSTSAAEPFIEISTSGIEVDGVQRQRHRGVEVDWVRRVHLNPAALQAQDISVDLYDMTLLLIRDTRDPSARSAGAWLYETDEHGSPKREMREPTGSVWTGTVHQREGAPAAAGVHGARVEIWESARGFSAEFRFGKLRYELIGDVLIKRDMRRFRVNENNDVRDIRPGPLSLLHIARESERADVMVMVIDTNSESPVCGRPNRSWQPVRRHSWLWSAAACQNIPSRMRWGICSAQITIPRM